MSRAVPDRSKRVDLSINRLISQIVPDNPQATEDENQHRHELLFRQVKEQLERPRPPPVADQNHASELIRRRLVQSDPNLALRFSNLYSRLLALPILDQKWAMLYLLHQLTDSPDPNLPDPSVGAELLEREEASQQRQTQNEEHIEREEATWQKQRQHEEHIAREEATRQKQRQHGEHIEAQRRRKEEDRMAREEARRRREADIEEYGTSLSPASSRESLRRPAPRRGAGHPVSVDSRDDLKNAKKFKPDGDSPYDSQRHALSSSEWKQNKGQADDELASSKRGVAIRSKLLADNYSGIEPTEPVLLRDLPYTLQGVSSTTLPFGPDYSLKLPPTLPPPLIGLLHILAEPSLLCKSLQDFVKTPTKGLLDQSLRAAISDELRSYLTLVATLEGQIRRALSSMDEKAPRGGIGKAGVTLKRCVVWTREATMGLRLLSLIAEESKTKKGGQIISLIHSFSSSHGDPIVGAFAERLLTPVTRPFYDILRHWIYDGELSDPYTEFFVQLKPTEAATKTKSGSTNVWDEKYSMEDTMIPSIITPAFAAKVHLIGKSLNFIRHSCHDAQWVESYSKASSKELRYGDTATLESWIDEAYKITMRRLVHLMTNKFHLFEHLQALKNYILLGQGDFIALLMESLAANLDRPAGAQYRHTLTAQLEHAIRGSNAQYDSPEVLRRLDARMLQLSHGDIGWDCFTLEYKIDAPVDVVVSDWGNRQYLKVFNFLWRIKRVEFALSSTWRKVTTGSRGVLQTNHETVRETWKKTRGFLAEMVHFVGQLQYYILFEVIESSWTELQTRLRREDATLDDIIKAHKNYLNSITHKGLLGARRKRFVASSASSSVATGSSAGGGAASAGTNEEDENGYMIQLGELLRTMLSYRECVDGLYSWSVSDFTRRQEADLLRHHHSKNNYQQHEEGGEGGSGSGPQSEFPALQERLRHLGDRFRTRLQILLGDLAYQPDIDLRFLGVAMNFNDVYQPVRRKAKSTPAPAPAQEKGKERERE